MPRANQQIRIPVTINGGGTTRVSEKRTAAIVKDAAEQAVAIYKRPSLAALVARVKKEVGDVTRAMGNEKKDWDPVLELAMIASNATGNVPMEYQLFALDRVRKYWYAELKEAAPEGEADDKARSVWAQKMRAALDAIEKGVPQPGVTTVEPEIIEPKKGNKA